MRRIEIREELEKRRKRNTAIISISLLGLLVLSSLGFAFISGFGYKNNANNQNAQNDNSVNDKITINYGGQSFSLLSRYDDIKNIDVEINSKPEDYAGQILYADISNHGVFGEIASSLGKFTGGMQEACYGKCEKNLPEKNCTGNANLIVWNQSLENKVYQKDKCVFIEGDIKAVDAFIYKLFSYQIETQ